MPDLTGLTVLVRQHGTVQAGQPRRYVRTGRPDGKTGRKDRNRPDGVSMQDAADRTEQDGWPGHARL